MGGCCKGVATGHDGRLKHVDWRTLTGYMPQLTAVALQYHDYHETEQQLVCFAR